MTRYYTQFGSYPEISGTFHMSGPQNADQIPQEVRALLDMSGVKVVAVTFDDGHGERINVFQEIKETACPTTTNN